MVNSVLNVIKTIVRVILRDCETSSFAKVRLQLYHQPRPARSDPRAPRGRRGTRGGSRPGTRRAWGEGHYAFKYILQDETEDAN